MILFSMAQMRDGLFERPHKALWRMVMGITLLYWMLLVFILFQNLNDVRRWLNHVDASLGVPLPERSYATDCDLYTPDHPNSSFNNLWVCAFFSRSLGLPIPLNLSIRLEYSE